MLGSVVWLSNPNQPRRTWEHSKNMFSLPVDKRTSEGGRETRSDSVIEIGNWFVRDVMVHLCVGKLEFFFTSLPCESFLHASQTGAAARSII